MVRMEVINEMAHKDDKTVGYMKETTFGPKICPVDKSPLSLEQIYKDAICNREILDMECFCSNKAGCQCITGQLRKMENFPISVLSAVHQWIEGRPRAVAYTERRMSEISMGEYDEPISITWMINRFQRSFRQQVTGAILSIDSQPFYFRGYKLCARVYLNGKGVGAGTHLSLFFVVMRGANDDVLPWPFQQRVSFELIDQSGDQPNIVFSFRTNYSSSSFQKPLTATNAESGCPCFVGIPLLEGQYVHDDCIFLKISVDNKSIQETSI